MGSSVDCQQRFGTRGEGCAGERVDDAKASQGGIGREVLS
jgi:hypothetical protein